MSTSADGDSKTTGMIAGQSAVRADLTANIREFLVWWRDELSQLSPSWIRRLFSGQDPVSTVQELDGCLVVKHQGDTRTHVLDPAHGPARLRLGAAQAVYLLPEDAVLRRRKQLPRAARAQARNIMALQIPSETPFAMDEVYADTRVIDEDSAAGEILADQGLAQRATVDGILTRMGDIYGVRLSGVDVADSGSVDGRAGFNFLPVEKRAVAQVGRFSLNRVLVIVLVGAAMFAGWAWRDLQDRRIAASEAALPAAEAGAEEALRVIKQISAGADTIQSMDVLLNDPLRFQQVYEATAALLPDGTWLEEFVYARPVVTITGLSANSAALVEILEASDLVASAKFASPVVTDSQTGAERFRMEITFAAAASQEDGE